MTTTSDKLAVWVVDDESSGFEVIDLLLRREGYKLTYFSSGIEALARLETHQPDVILLDVMMPELDGIETCRRVRANSQWASIPIIMVTALDAKEDLVRSLDAGADDFLTKPVNGLELRARVRSMLRIKQQYDALQATIHLRQDLTRLVGQDLQPPLSTVLLGSHLLLSSNLSPSDRERVDMIHAAGRELDAIVHELFRLAHVESGKLVINPVEVDLNELVDVVVANFQTIADAKPVQLISQLSEQKRWVSLDTHLVHRLLDTLLSNAIQVSPANSAITVQVDYPTPPDFLGQVVIRIADAGTGTAKELQQSIFDRYEPGSLVSGTAQIGLGLAFCKLVAEAHGGKILVTDNQPTGSIVTVEL